MGLCGEFDYVLGATTANLVMHYEPFCGMKPCSKIHDDFRAMSHKAGFVYGLWAIAQVLVMRYGP